MRHLSASKNLGHIIPGREATRQSDAETTRECHGRQSRPRNDNGCVSLRGGHSPTRQSDAKACRRLPRPADAGLAMTEVRIFDGRRAPSVCCFFRNSIHPISRYKYDGILVREMGCCSGYGFFRPEANRNVCGCAKRRMQFADGGITPRPSSRGHRADRRAGCRQACRTSPARSYRSCGH